MLQPRTTTVGRTITSTKTNTTNQPSKRHKTGPPSVTIYGGPRLVMYVLS